MVEMFGVLQETIMVHILQKFFCNFLIKVGKICQSTGDSQILIQKVSKI